jgi:hypothetical protein
MSAPTPPPKTLSTFTQLTGGAAQFIPSGTRLVALGGGLATAWDASNKPIEIPLPSNVDPYGARWTADGAQLHVGLGVVDLAARAWRAEPGLQKLNPPGRQFEFPVRQVAWFADGAHVALLLRTRDAKGQPAQEVAIATLDGTVRGRHPVDAAIAMVASQDRVLVAQTNLTLLDLDGKVIAEPARDRAVLRVSEGAGMFAAVRAGGGVLLIRPSDGSVIASWDLAVNDAVPVPGGVAAVDRDGTVHIGCIDGTKIKEVASAPSGAQIPIIQHVGDKLVVAGGTVDPIHVATFANPCH